MRIGIPDAGEIPDDARAPAGGAVGVNGYRYEGGQFLPSTDAPPGTFRIAPGRKGLVRPLIDLVGPGIRLPQPGPFVRAIYNPIMQITLHDADGTLRVNERLAIAVEHYGRGIRPVAHGVHSIRTYDVEELCAMWNAGERWIDFTPG